jgi:hypothetical protein
MQRTGASRPVIPSKKVGELGDGIKVADVAALWKQDKADPELIERALRAPLFGDWEDSIRERRLNRPHSP